MRPLRCAALAALALAAVGCDALDDFEETFVDELVIPGSAGAQGPFTAAYDGTLNDLDLSTSSGFREAGVDPDDVDSIKVIAGTLTIDLGDPRLNDLSRYLESLELYVVSDGQPRTLVTRLDSFPMADIVDLPLDASPELKPFATDSGMRFEADLRLRQRPALNLRLVTSLTIGVDINLLGA